jgi:hypothetical protein
MLWNIVDRRTNKYDNKIDAVFEPAHHDNSIDGASQAEEDDTWTITSEYNTTIRDACHKCEEDWWSPVTLYLYDANSKPLG